MSGDLPNDLPPTPLQARRARALIVEVSVVDVSPDGKTKTPRDVTNDTLEWTLSRHPADSNILVTKTEGQGLTKTDPVAGAVEIAIEEDDNDRSPGAYYHELLLVGDDGRPHTTMWGPYEVLRAQVRP